MSTSKKNKNLLEGNSGKGKLKKRSQKEGIEERENNLKNIQTERKRETSSQNVEKNVFKQKDLSDTFPVIDTNLDIVESNEIEKSTCPKNDMKKYIIFIFVSLVVFIDALLMIRLSLKVDRIYDRQYIENSNLDYDVYLKPNDFYEESHLPKDRQYISSLIDYIDLDFDYSFTNYNKEDNLDYSYYVKATVLVDNLQGKNIYKNESTLVEKKTFAQVPELGFHVVENVKVNYDTYNSLANNFVSSYGISAKSRVVISLCIDVISDDPSQNIDNKEVIKLEIPLTNKNVDISMNYELSNSKINQSSVQTTKKIKNPVTFFIAIMLIILDLSGIGIVLFYHINKNGKSTLYSKTLKRILRDYERYITETTIKDSVEKMLNTISLRIEVVKTFDDLINVRDSIEKPILFHEERPGEEAIFYIIDDKITYVYIMSAKNLKNKNK